MRKNSIKNTRINGEVQKVLAQIIRGEIKVPRISPLTSVVSVEVAPDLKSCKAWISVLGNEESRKATYQGLKSAEGFIKNRIAKEINLRNTPSITFKPCFPIPSVILLGITYSTSTNVFPHCVAPIFTFQRQ